jgi:hypothetical protein
MKKWKRVDCVQMKEEIQTELLKSRQRLSDDQIDAEIKKKLERSQSPAARFWREVCSKRKAA